MRHKHLAGALVELRKSTKTASGADGVLHHPPEAFDWVEVMSAVGWQEMKAKLIPTTTSALDMLISLPYVASNDADYP